jgi:UDP-glucose 4-epimerase
MQRRRVLVTGAAGFIGSHLCDRLLAEGLAVAGIDNLSLGRMENLRGAVAHPAFVFWRGDVNDLAACGRWIAEAHAREPFEAVWHLAANSDIPAGVRDPRVDLEKTFLTTFNVLGYCRELRIPDFAFASTSAVYGEKRGPLHEDVGPLFPISNYGAMKLASEAAISAGTETYLRRTWVFRFPNVVGSRATHGAIYDFIRKLRATPGTLEVLGNGRQEKPYMHVSDLVDAMWFIHSRTSERINYYNIAESRTTTRVSAMAESVVRQVSPSAQIRYTGGDKGWPGDVAQFQYSVEKLARLGWAPKLDSNQAVDLAVREIAAEIGAAL